MSACLQDIADFGLRSIGMGEFRLPTGEMTLCRQVVLIGSGICLLYTSDAADE